MKLASLQAIAGALNDYDVPFIVVGGLAVNAHGYGRMTHDVDIVARLEPRVVQRAFEALASLGYRPLVPIAAQDFGDADLRKRWIAEKGMTVLNFASDLHRETPVDVFVTEPFGFDDEYRRAIVENVAEGVPVRIVSLPTLIELKRDAGRPQDLADIHELRIIHGDAIDG